MASLCALDLQYNFSSKDIGCFIMGSPRIGNYAFKRSIERRLPYLVRVTYGSDLVPQAPPECFGFDHLEVYYHLGPKRRAGLGTMKDHDGRKYLEAIRTELAKKL